MTKEEVLKIHTDVFYDSLKSQTDILQNVADAELLTKCRVVHFEVVPP